jgi:hypothetical protein
MDISRKNFYIKYDEEKGYCAFAGIDLKHGDEIIIETNSFSNSFY